MSDVDLLAKFRSLGEERLRAMNQGLLELEQGTGSAATLDDVLRELHTIKGESRMLGLLAVHRVAHRAEDLLQHARVAKAERDPSTLEEAYAGLDLLSSYLAEEGDAVDASEEPRAVAYDQRITAWLAAHGKPTAPKAATSPAAAAPAPAPAPAPAARAQAAPTAAPAPTPPPPEGPGLPSREGRSVVRVPGEIVDELTRTSGVLGLLQAQMDRTARAAASLQDAADEARRALGEATTPEGRRAALERLAGLARGMSAELRALREAGFSASLRQQRLRDTVASLRLASIAGLFARFPRMVRELARDVGKEVRVEIHAGELGADQLVLDALSDPLLHLVRNALDHGLEAPAVRESLGKARHGTIRLSAGQAGRFVEILVGDDGRGIDPKVVGEAAVAKGLLSEADVARMTTDELYGQLFRPSFSTQETVTELSGRGVGLDVVKRAVEALGGTVHVRSEPGRGATFVLRVPVSSAVVDALVLEVGEAVFAVPAAYVERALVVAPSALEPTGMGHSVRLPGGERARVLDLADLVPERARGPAAEEKPIPLVVVLEGERRLALRAGRFLGERSLVQETLDPFLHGLRGVTGTAVLADGRLAVLLNVVQLFTWAREEEATATRAARSPTVEKPVRLALVAEDSELTRDLVAAALRKAGLEVVTAVDGQEALARLRGRRPALLVTDVEMPVMDGIELVRRVRAEPSLAGLPILVFTTRDRPETKREAADAGADAYLVKREFEEQALLATVADLLARAPGGAS